MLQNLANLTEGTKWGSPAEPFESPCIADLLRNTKHIVIGFGKLDETNELTSLDVQVIKRFLSWELNLFVPKKRPQTNELSSHKTTKLQLGREISPH